MSFALTGHTPTAVSGAGGALLKVLGDFSAYRGREIHVHVGPNGDTTDPICYSGIPEQGSSLFALTDTELRCYLPELSPSGDGTPYSVFVRTTDAEVEETSPDDMEVFPRDYNTMVFSMKQSLPPTWNLGARTMSQLEPT